MRSCLQKPQWNQIKKKKKKKERKGRKKEINKTSKERKEERKTNCTDKKMSYKISSFKEILQELEKRLAWEELT
jgi:hypothetical protein